MHFAPLVSNESGISVAITEDGKKRMFVKRKDVTFPRGSDDQITIIDDPSFYEEFDASVIAAAKENKQLWWGRNIQDGTIDKAFIKSYDDGLDTHVIEGKTKFFLSDKSQVDITSFTGDTMCDVVIEPSRIVFYKRHFEIDWRIVQLIAKPPPEVAEPEKEDVEDYPEDCMFED